MKKAYSAPRLFNHGNISEVTEANLTSNASDQIFGTQQGTVPGPGGSLDACVSRDIRKCQGADL
jgi:hypothetical protein